MYDKVIIVGSSSLIATKTIPFLNLGESNIYLVNRSNTKMHTRLPNSKVNYLYVDDYTLESSISYLSEKVKLDKKDRLLIINFIGNFGSISALSGLDTLKFSEEIQSNLIPFASLGKLLHSAGSGSLFLTFSGAGIGGDNLDLASYSYLASKAAMMFLVEAFDNELRNTGKRVGAIAPGAFPSRMQEKVASSSMFANLTIDRISQARKILESPVDPLRLIALLKYLVAHPNAAGGRIWSANFDDPFIPPDDSQFGKLRRYLD
jgi:short-subunit dehydrogenase